MSVAKVHENTRNGFHRRSGLVKDILFAQGYDTIDGQITPVHRMSLSCRRAAHQKYSCHLFEGADRHSSQLSQVHVALLYFITVCHRFVLLLSASRCRCRGSQ